MGDRGRRIIEGLKEAIAGDFPAVTIDGVRWVRQAGPMTPTERIERAARAIDPGAWKKGYDEVFAERRADSLRIAAGALSEAYPELTSNTHWLAPMEATEGMIRHLCVHPDMGPGGMVIRYSIDKVPRAWRDARDSYLEQQPDIQAGLDALKEPKAGTWDEIKGQDDMSEDAMLRFKA